MEISFYLVNIRNIHLPDPNYSPEIVVFGLISNDEAYKFVIVERTLTLEQENRIRYLGNRDQIETIINNAIVFVYDEVDTAYFTFYQREPNAAYFYNDYFQRGIYLDLEHKLTITPGKTYQLKVEIPGEKIITGSTKMPIIPMIKMPLQNSRIQKNLFSQTEVNWQDHQETAAYQILVIVEAMEGENNYRYNTLHDYLINSPPTTLREIDPYFLFNFNHVNRAVTIKIMALDRNYFDYKRSHSGFSTLSGNYINTVKNGIGIFGSITIDSVDVILY